MCQVGPVPTSCIQSHHIIVCRYVPRGGFLTEAHDNADMPPLNSSNRTATAGARGKAKPLGTAAAKLGMKRCTSPTRRPASGATAAIRPAVAKGRAAPTAAAVSGRVAPRPAPGARTSAAPVKPAAARPQQNASRLTSQHRAVDAHPPDGSQVHDQWRSVGDMAQQEQHYTFDEQPVAAAGRRPAAVGIPSDADQVPARRLPTLRAVSLQHSLRPGCCSERFLQSEAKNPVAHRRAASRISSGWSSRQRGTPRCSAWQPSTARAPAAAAAASHPGRATAPSCSRSCRMASGGTALLTRSTSCSPPSCRQMDMPTSQTWGQTMMATMQALQTPHESAAQPSSTFQTCTSTRALQIGVSRRQAAALQDHMHTAAGIQRQARWSSWRRRRRPGTRRSGETAVPTALRTRTATSTPMALATVSHTTLSAPSLASRCCLQCDAMHFPTLLASQTLYSDQA